MSKKVIWYDGRKIANENRVFPFIYNSHFEYLLITDEMVPKIKPPHRLQLIAQVNEKTSWETLPKNIIVLSNQVNLLQHARENGYKTALYQRITNQADMDTAWREGSRNDFLVVELIAETNIPLELLIARLQDKETVLLKVVSNLEEAKIAFGVMEAGSDGVVLKNEEIPRIQEFNQFMTHMKSGHLELVKGKVTVVEHIGMGYRACIDTTNLLTQTEGMIIGSTSSGGLLVSSETHFLPYMELRPFRVNAGAVHSYIWTADGMTAYLTELKAGSQLLCVDTKGNTREVSAGRIKIEMRPLLKIEVEANDLRINTIVQDDWHIRIFGGNGEVRNASTIQKGDELLAYTCSGGRHVGIKIDEKIEER